MKTKYIIKELTNTFDENLVSVVLFGSRARKNYDETSDIDIIIVVKDYKEEDIQNLEKITY